MTARHCVKVPRDWSRIRILRQGLTLEEAKRWEQFYVARFGRKTLGTGHLLNKREGGEGALVCPETRAQIAQSVRARYEAGVYEALNSSESVKRRSYSRQANKATELNLPVDAYLAMPKQERDRFVKWRKEHPDADYQEWVATRKHTAVARKYGFAPDEWSELTAKERKALVLWNANGVATSAREYLELYRRGQHRYLRGRGPGRNPKINRAEVFQLSETGMSQRSIAKQLGCHRASVSKILNNRRQVEKPRASA
jgi:hypothetical protein